MLTMTKEMYERIMTGKDVNLPNDIKYSIMGETGYRKGEMTLYSTNLDVDFFTSIITDYSNLMMTDISDGNDQQIIVISQDIDKVQYINTNNNSQVSAVYIKDYNENVIHEIGLLMEEVTFRHIKPISLIFDVERATNVIANVIQKIAYAYNLPCIVLNRIRQYEPGEVKIEDLNPMNMGDSRQMIYNANYAVLLYLKDDKINVNVCKQNARIVDTFEAKAFQAINSINSDDESTLNIIKEFNGDFDSFKAYKVCEKDGFTFICGKVNSYIDEYDSIKEFIIGGDKIELGSEEPNANTVTAFKYLDIDVTEPKPKYQFEDILYLYIIKDNSIFKYQGVADIVDILDDFNITDEIEAEMSLNGTLSLVEDFYRIGLRTAEYHEKSNSIDELINLFVSRSTKHLKLIADRLKIRPHESNLDITVTMSNNVTYEFNIMIQELIEKRLINILENNFEFTEEEAMKLNIGINFMVDEGYHVPRDKWQDKMVELLEKAHMFVHGGMQCNVPVELEKYVTKEDGFENDIFRISPYDYNADEDEAEPNFIFKPTGYAIKWYKYALRASVANKDISYDEFEEMINQCIASLPEIKEKKEIKEEKIEKPIIETGIKKIQTNSFYGKFGGFHTNDDNE